MKSALCRAIGVLPITLLISLPSLALADTFYVVSGAVNPADAKSKELESLTAEQANLVARRDLLATLQPTGQFHADPSSPVDGNVWGMTFVTWPYPTRYESFCREDAVTLHHSLVSHHDDRGDRWVSKREPQGIDAQQLFHADALPIDRAGKIATCDAGHPDPRAHWFVAPSELDAARAANMFYAGVSQARSGTQNVESCDHAGGDDCRKLIGSMDMSKVDAVRVCDQSGDDICYVYSVGANELTIRAKAGADPSLNPAPITLIRVDAVTSIME